MAADESTCTDGHFELGTPTETSARGGVIQVDGDHTLGPNGNGNAWYTAPNQNSGDGDVDFGPCILTSRDYEIENDSVLSFWYFYGVCRDNCHSSLVIDLSFDGGVEYTMDLIRIENTTSVGEWTFFRRVLPSNTTQVTLRVQVSDQNDCIVETGIDDFGICSI